MKVGALFAGYGGLDLAVSSVLDAEMAWCAEVEAAPSKILAARFPDAPNLGDVTRIDWAAVEPVDILTGGSPCQDLSHAGKRAGMKDGTRSGLWSSMCEAIEVIRPRLVVWENVRGALSAEATAGDVESCDFCVGDAGDVHLRALGRVLGDLAELGYDAAWYDLRAADVGAPHGRWRVFVLAWPAADADLFGTGQNGRGIEAPDNARRNLPPGRGGPNLDDSLPAWGSREWRDLTLLKTPTSQLAVNGGSQHPDKRKAGGHGPTLADEVEHLLPTPTLPHPAADSRDPAARMASRHQTELSDVVRLLPTPAVNDMGRAYTPDEWDEWTAKMKATHGNGNGHGKSLNIEALRLLPTPKAGDADFGLPRTSGRPPEMSTHLATKIHYTDFGQYAPAIERWERVLGRVAPPPTEPSGRDGAHRLSPRFVEWMMGLPDGWVTDIDMTRNEQLKALGNGVVPQQAAAALRYLLSVKEAA